MGGGGEGGLGAGVQKKYVLDPRLFFFWNSPIQFGSVPCDQKFPCKWNFIIFLRLSHQTRCLLHIISSLSCHFRSWDYPDNFGIYSQLDRKSKTWFLFFLNVCVSWIEQDKKLTAFTSKIQVFCRPEWTKGGLHENEYWQFSNAKMRFPNS